MRILAKRAGYIQLCLAVFLFIYGMNRIVEGIILWFPWVFLGSAFALVVIGLIVWLTYPKDVMIQVSDQQAKILQIFLMVIFVTLLINILIASVGGQTAEVARRVLGALLSIVAVFFGSYIVRLIRLNHA